MRGQDEEGQAHLHEADRLALADGDLATVAQARAELGYVDFLRARYDRAERWLTDAIELAQGSAQVLAKADDLPRDGAQRPRQLPAGGRPARRGRPAGPRGRRPAPRGVRAGDARAGRPAPRALDDAPARLAESVALAERGHWLSFLPWPEALQGEVLLARREPDWRPQALERAFARACHLGDPCWEGMSARGLALVAEAAGRTGEAFDTLLDARARSTRVADPYVWLRRAHPRRPVHPGPHPRAPGDRALGRHHA